MCALFPLFHSSSHSSNGNLEQKLITRQDMHALSQRGAPRHRSTLLCKRRILTFLCRLIVEFSESEDSVSVVLLFLYPFTYTVGVIVYIVFLLWLTSICINPCLFMLLLEQKKIQNFLKKFRSAKVEFFKSFLSSEYCKYQI